MIPILMVMLCLFLRVLPHPANFAPVGAAAIFSGRTLPLRTAYITTFIAMFLSDFALSRIHGYSLFTLATPFVYAGFAGQILFGRWLRNKKGGAIGAAVSGSVFFFIVSNFGVWVEGLYGHTLQGLATCYVAAIPFYGATLASDVIWTVALTLAYRALSQKYEARGSKWFPVQKAQVF